MEPDRSDSFYLADSVSHGKALPPPAGNTPGESLYHPLLPAGFPRECLSHHTAPPPLAHSEAPFTALGESAREAERPASPATATVAAFPGQGDEGEDFPAEYLSHHTAPPPLAHSNTPPPPLRESAGKAERPAPPATATVAAFPGEGEDREDFSAEYLSHRTAPPPLAHDKAPSPHLGESTREAERPASPAAATVAAFPGQGEDREDFPEKCLSHHTAPPPLAHSEAPFTALGESAREAERPASPATATVAAFPGQGDKGEEFLEVEEYEEIEKTEGRPHTKDQSQLRLQLRFKRHPSLETSAWGEDSGGGGEPEEMKRKRDGKDARGVFGAGGEAERGVGGVMEKGGEEESRRKRHERCLDTGSAATAAPPTPQVRPSQGPPRDEVGLTEFRQAPLRDDNKQDQMVPPSQILATQQVTDSQQAPPPENYKENQMFSPQGIFEDRFQRSQHILLAHSFEEHWGTDGARRGPGGGGGAGGMESRLALPQEEYEELQSYPPQGFQHSPQMPPHRFQERWDAEGARGGGGGWREVWDEFWGAVGRNLGCVFGFPGETHPAREQQDYTRFGGGGSSRGDAAAGGGAAAAAAAAGTATAPRIDLSFPPYTMHQSQANLFFDTAAFAVPPLSAHVTASSAHTPSARASGYRQVLVVHRGDITRWCVDGATDAIVSDCNQVR
ncbi:unnamed protein product [Closterium sp. Yama58-4]|nr:unnamed protein product [Closterium sp. Yama58-4]